MLDKCSIRSARYGELIRLYALVVGSMVSVATKLRLTPQSSRDSRNIKHVSLAPKPWELTGRTEQLDLQPRSWDRPAPGSTSELPSDPCPAA